MNDATPALNDPYATIAELYDLEHDDFDADIALLLNFAEVVGDPILELGCGSGRLLVPLAEAGFNVTGLDNSRPMLDRAEGAIQKAGVGDRVTLFEGDMREADNAPGGPFGLVIYSLNSLMHLTTAGDQREALIAARKALDPRGQLIIDTINPSIEQVRHLLDGPHHEGWWELPDGSVIDKWSHRKASAHPQVIDTLLWYDRTWPDGHVTRTRSAFPLRYVHPSELALMLELAGFVEPMFYGSYDLDPFDPDTDRLLVTAEVTPSRTPPRFATGTPER
jgi:SAM-dependent methyltransferase